MSGSEWDFLEEPSWKEIPDIPEHPYVPKQAGRRNMPTNLELAAMGLLGTGALYTGNALVSGGNERWDRTLGNTAGNIVGGVGGYALGSLAPEKYRGLAQVAGGAIGGLVGGWGQDRLANIVDPTGGQQVAVVDANDLINAHINANDPIQQQAMLQEQIRQSKQQQVAMQRQQMMQAQAQMQQRMLMQQNPGMAVPPGGMPPGAMSGR